jgi:hypothetical protein
MTEVEEVKKSKKLHDNNAASNTKRKDFVQHFI